MSIFDKIHDELFESDPKTKQVVKPVTVPPIATSPSPITPYNFGTDTAPVVGGAPAAPVYAPSTGGTINPDAMKAVTDGVFVPINGRPSRYVIFSKIYETVGHNPQTALMTMQAMDPSITAKTILDDISSHLSLLDQVTASAEATFIRVATERLGGADQKIKELTTLNEQAQAEIARHQKETGERIGQISQLQNERATDEAQIGQAKAAAIAAEGVVKSQLLTAQTILSTIQ
jgi:hypothetical protein